ncbi:MAG: DUF5667 domain-containing protein [Candidatus Pacebacteria bacterium]|nr:DUF5667 domain-containing protein [Candidatus Paceibacterota bacterium]MDR3582993.1 DUF5667 domain-containing protein [Candidatus Paceibacterota bacterium]
MIKSIKNYIRFQRQTRRLKRALKYELKPRPEFFRAARKNFLAEFEEKNFSSGKKENERPRATRKYSWRFAFLGTVLAFLAGGGVMAMACQSGVSPGQPLYSVKRAGENVQLALASKSQEPFVHYQLAKNRLAEIKDLNDEISSDRVLDSSGNSSSQGVPLAGSADKNQAEIGKLDREFDAQIDAALKKIDQIDDRVSDQYADLSGSDQRKEKELCQSIAVTLKEHSLILSDYDANYKEDFSTWQKYCGRTMDVSLDSVSLPVCH